MPTKPAPQCQTTGLSLCTPDVTASDPQTARNDAHLPDSPVPMPSSCPRRSLRHRYPEGSTEPRCPHKPQVSHSPVHPWDISDGLHMSRMCTDGPQVSRLHRRSQAPWSPDSPHTPPTSKVVVRMCPRSPQTPRHPRHPLLVLIHSRRLMHSYAWRWSTDTRTSTNGPHVSRCPWAPSCSPDIH